MAEVKARPGTPLNIQLDGLPSQQPWNVSPAELVRRQLPLVNQLVYESLGNLRYSARAGTPIHFSPVDFGIKGYDKR